MFGNIIHLSFPDGAFPYIVKYTVLYEDFFHILLQRSPKIILDVIVLKTNRRLKTDAGVHFLFIPLFDLNFENNPLQAQSNTIV
jgi:hypothetical protein